MRTSALLSLLCAAGCAGARFQNAVFRDSQTAYRVGALGPDWSRQSLGGANLVFVNPSGGTILANATCKGTPDLSLDVLANQELFGVEGQREERREVFTLDGRAALRRELSGTLDGVPVKMDLVVLKKDTCTYDLGLISSREAFPKRDEDFWRFVRGFNTLPKGA